MGLKMILVLEVLLKNPIFRGVSRKTNIYIGGELPKKEGNLDSLQV